MNGISKLLSRILGHAPEHNGEQGLVPVVRSLVPRGALRQVHELPDVGNSTRAFFLVSPKGNFGWQLRLGRVSRSLSECLLLPYAPPIAPFGQEVLQDPFTDPILQVWQHWVKIGGGTLVDVDLDDRYAMLNSLVRHLEDHPTAKWMRQLLLALGKGKFINRTSFRHGLAFGFITYLRNLSNRDPIQEVIEPALETLCRIDAYWKACDRMTESVDASGDLIAPIKAVIIDQFPAVAHRVLRKPLPEPVVKKTLELDLSLPDSLR